MKIDVPAGNEILSYCVLHALPDGRTCVSARGASKPIPIEEVAEQAAMMLNCIRCGAVQAMEHAGMPRDMAEAMIDAALQSLPEPDSSRSESKNTPPRRT